MRWKIARAQCKYAEAERELKSEPEALHTPHGVDLYARILWSAGQKSAARRVWEELAQACPDFEPAAKALSADEDALRFECPHAYSFDKRQWYVMCGLAAVALGVAFSIGKFCGGAGQIVAPAARPTVIAECVLKGNFGGSELKSLRSGILTNLTDGTVLVIRGGSGKQITDRQRKLAVVADCINYETKVPVSKMYFQPAEAPTDEVILQIVPAYSGKEAAAK